MLRSIEELRRAGPNQPFRVTIDEAEVNRLASEYVAGSGVSVSELAINLRPEEVVATGRASLAGVGVQLQVALVPVKQDAMVRAELRSMTMNGAPAPGFIRNQVAQTINRQITAQNLPIVVYEVVLGEQEVTVEGITR